MWFEVTTAVWKAFEEFITVSSPLKVSFSFSDSVSLGKRIDFQTPLTRIKLDLNLHTYKYKFDFEQNS